MDMFSYAAKRITRGRSIFIPLFLSVALAVTLFSGVLQGADAVGVALLDKALEAADVDIIATAQDKNVTKTRYYEIDDIIGEVDNVESVRHFVRWNVEVNVTGWNKTVPFMVIAIPKDSELMEDISGVDELEDGKIYVDAASVNASELVPGERVTLTVDTYQPYNPPGFERFPHHYVIGDAITIDDRAFHIFTARYNLFIRNLLIGTGETSRRPEYHLIIMSEATLRSILDPLYSNMRRPTGDIFAVALVSLYREDLVNPWDIQGSLAKVGLIHGEINSLIAQYLYLPVNHLGQVLESIETLSSQMKMNTMMVVAPAFFTAWYLGVTVLDVALSLRRREIGLLFTRGMTHRQVLYIFLFEALIVSLIAGGAGVLIGASILPLVIPDIGLLQVFRSVSPFTLAASIGFSGALALMAVYKPAKRASEMAIIDALREYQGEEEAIGSWHEPMLALLLGAYKFAMLLLGLRVEFFAPASPNLVVFILYSTWWGVDYILGIIAPILFFWGFTKLFIQYVPWFEDLLGKLAGVLVGDIAKLSALSARRNLKRITSSAFMAALVIGYSVTIIGRVAGTDDFINRAVRITIGADASVWLFEGKQAKDLATEIAGMEGVASATVETWFSPETYLGDTPVRAIEPFKWMETAYMEEGWLEGDDVFLRMNESDVACIMEKGAADRLQVKINGSLVTRLDHKIFTLRIVGLFGREPWGRWTLQNPTLYVPDTFLEKVKEKYITQRRILVKFEEGVDIETFIEDVEALDPDVERVDVTEVHLSSALSNVFLVGPRRVEELGVYFSALVASVGIVLVVLTVLRSRWKELNIMAIRGFSSGQLAITLLVENIGMALFAVVLGFAMGFISLRGEAEVFNAAVAAGLERRVVFPFSAQLNLGLVVGLLLAATAMPILIAVRRISENPTWRTVE